MPEFELKFEVGPVSGTAEDRLAAETCAIFATHFGVSTVSMIIEASGCAAAAQTAISTLNKEGVVVVRLIDDLVGRSEVAARAKVTRQAVAHWLSGKRQGKASFPAPFVLAEGGLWLWGEILPVLQTLGYCKDDDLSYPTARDSQKINALVYASLGPRDSGLWQTSGAGTEPSYLAAI